ncbi:MAG: ABC transporter permease [Eubacteriales bacterium]
MIQDKFLKHCKQHKRFIFCCQIICLLIFLSLWEISSQKGWIDIFFFSSPSRIVMLFIEMSQSGEMLSHISITLLETLLSFLIVNIVSIAVAIILLSSNTISEISEPYLVMLNALPKSALAPLIIVWLGTGLKTIIVAGASVAIFGSIINLYTGFHQVDTEKIKLIYTLGGTNGDTLNKVIIPASIPIIISNMKVNIGLSLVGVIIGEFLAARKGLGYLIIYSSQVFKLDLLIMSIIILCFIALFLYQLIHIMEKKYGTSRT